MTAVRIMNQVLYVEWHMLAMPVTKQVKGSVPSAIFWNMPTLAPLIKMPPTAMILRFLSFFILSPSFINEGITPPR